MAFNYHDQTCQLQNKNHNFKQMDSVRKGGIN